MERVLKFSIVIFLTICWFDTNAQVYLDYDFNDNANNGFSGETYKIVALGSQYLVAGDFTTYDGTSRTNLVLINADGTLDGSFDVGALFDGDIITDIIVDNSNDDIYISGTFAEGVVRLSSDGTVDNTFTFDDTDYDGPINAITLDANGKLIAGQGVGTSGLSARIARFDSDGSLDETFNNGDFTGKFSSTLSISSGTKINDVIGINGGKVLVAGNFTSFDGSTAEGIVMLDANGSIDNTFALDYLNEVSNFEKTSVEMEDDGKVLVGGLRATGAEVERFNLDGSRVIWSSSSSGGGFKRPVYAIHSSGTDDILISGDFGLLSKTYDDGFDQVIEVGGGFASSTLVPEVKDFIVDNQGGIIAVGAFSSYNGTSTGFIARVQECNSVDITEDLQTFSYACVGDDKSFSITASGSGLSYQWQVSTSSSIFSDITDDGTYSGSTTSELTLTGVTGTFDSYEYRCIVSDASCSVTSTSTNFLVFDSQAITSQPQDETVCAGENAVFSIDTEGSIFAIQWQVNEGSGFEDLTNGGNVSGVNDVTLTISDVSEVVDGFLYRAILSTCATPLASDEALLTVNEIPVITESGQQRPKVCVTGDAEFTVEATGTGLTYQWQYRPNGAPNGSYADLPNGGEVSGATTATLSLTGVDNTFDKAYLTEVDGSVYAQFRCKVTSNGCDVYTTEVRLLQIHPEPTFQTQPTSPSTFCDSGSGISTSFTAIATIGDYQWQVDKGAGFINIVDDEIYSGSNTSTVSLAGASSAFDGFIYRCSIESCPSAIYSDEATLSIGDYPIIISQPQDVTVCTGSNASFIVEATGTNLSYQWQQRQSHGSYADIFDGGSFSGTSSNTLQISNVDGSLDNERFLCVVSSGECSVNSNNRRVSVQSEPSFSLAPADQTICEGEDAVFSRSASNFNGVVNTYQWQEAMSGSDIFADITDGENYSGTTSTTLTVISPAANKNGNRYRLKVLGCVQDIVSDPADLTVIAEPIISESPLPQTVCDGDLVTFDANAIGDNLTYQWFVNDGDGTFESVTNASDIGEYSFNAEISQDGWIYKCVITPASPCQSLSVETTEVTLTVNDSPAVVENVTISDFPICEGENAIASINLLEGTPAVQWQVDEGSGFSNLTDGDEYSGTTTLDLVINLPGAEMTGFLYRGVLSATGCEFVTPSVELNVFPQFDQPVITADESDPSAPILSIQNLPADFDAVGGIVNWYLEDEFVATSLTFTPTVSGNYSAIIEETGTTVVCTSIPSEPYLFESVLGLYNGQLNIYPNPASNRLMIDTDGDLEIRIYNVSGRLELNGRISKHKELNIQSLAPGQYIVQLLKENAVVYSDKIIKIN